MRKILPIYESKSVFEKSKYKGKILYSMDKVTIREDARRYLENIKRRYSEIGMNEGFIESLAPSEFILHEIVVIKKDKIIPQGYMLMNTNFSQTIIEVIEEEAKKRGVEMKAYPMTERGMKAQDFIDTLPYSITKKPKTKNVTIIDAYTSQALEYYKKKLASETLEESKKEPKETPKFPEAQEEVKEEEILEDTLEDVLEETKPSDNSFEQKLNSIRKNSTYKKSISKLKLSYESVGTDILAILYHMRSNLIIDFDDSEYNKIQKRYHPSKEGKFRRVEPFIDLSFLNKIVKGGNHEDFVYVVGEVNLPDGTRGTEFHILSIQNKLTKRLHNRIVQMPTPTEIDGVIYDNPKIHLYNLTEYLYSPILFEKLNEQIEVSESMATELRKILGYMTNSKRSDIENRLNHILKVGKPFIGFTPENLQRIYEGLIGVFSQEILMETQNKNTSYATSFMTKKNINKKTQQAMEESTIKSKNIKYVEIDNDVDLEKFRLVEQDFENFVDKLPDLREPVDLRFRKLGNHSSKDYKVMGIYFPNFKSIAVDLDSTNSFVHEYGHALDYDLASPNYLTKSSEDSFKNIVLKYRETYLAHALDEDKKIMTYFFTPPEIFARGFEQYMKTKGVSNRLTDSQERSGHMPFNQNAQLLEETINYFEKLF